MNKHLELQQQILCLLINDERHYTFRDLCVLYANHENCLYYNPNLTRIDAQDIIDVVQTLINKNYIKYKYDNNFKYPKYSFDMLSKDHISLVITEIGKLEYLLSLEK